VRSIWSGVRLVNPADVALDARYLQADQVALIPGVPIQGTVDLSHARIGLLLGDPACWPPTLDLSGLTYQALEPQLPARKRLRWLARHPQGDEPQPYVQLASHYSAMGQLAQARCVGNRTVRSMTSCQSSRLASSATWRDSMMRSSAPMRSCSRRSM
jgi:hypothetical protein